jgi:hypothetical protein
VREYVLSELVSLLNKYFADVRVYYQGFSSTYHDQVMHYASSIQNNKKALPAIIQFLVNKVYRPLKPLIPHNLTNYFIRRLLKLRYPQPNTTDIVISPEPPADLSVFIAICREPR